MIYQPYTESPYRLRQRPLCTILRSLCTITDVQAMIILNLISTPLVLPSVTIRWLNGFLTRESSMSCHAKSFNRTEANTDDSPVLDDSEKISGALYNYIHLRKCTLSGDCNSTRMPCRSDMLDGPSLDGILYGVSFLDGKPDGNLTTLHCALKLLLKSSRTRLNCEQFRIVMVLVCPSSQRSSMI